MGQPEINAPAGAEWGERERKARILNARIVGALTGPRAALLPGDVKDMLRSMGELLVELAAEVDDLAGVCYGE